ncbi:CYTH domain-containing protein [Jeotgalibacillus soli]|uniref:CYTH domain-containing protein n=1 Tax=Jeotgalibacillus soli TaxID=889306 RepID=A0A0C2VNX1_9BACL|nr:CYTH domain-containing protein [Jeotgalibacillus soli]KIL45703.1 hypothetical protein KP78_20520 [Jeotgalibacillus soli]
MSQELEIEFKNLLTKNEYLRLKSSFYPEDGQIISQENHYFDTPLFQLKEQGCALRIRVKDGSYQLTLKQPVEEGILETHQSLHTFIAKDMMMGGGPPEGEVYELLEIMNIPVRDVVLFGSLKTNRIETHYENGLLVLDQSFYLDEEDYEVEYEVTDRDEGEKAFIKLLSTYNIPVRETDSKIKRFYKEKIRQLKL